MFVDEDLTKLFQVFPNYLRIAIQYHSNRLNLIEVVLDLGKKPEGRFFDGTSYLSNRIVSWQDLDFCTKQVSNFNDDNRAGIERTLHRISCLRNRKGVIIGLTCRVGRSLFGTVSIVRDLLSSNQSILILGKPGVGKTTTIREIARILSDELRKRVVIVDTSNEIGGNSDIPHSGIGRARRMQVSKSELQHNVMVEAVENHMPEVIIVDEIGTDLEVLAVRTIAERGVQVIGTVHGNNLENLIKNPILMDIVGGVQNVILGDEEAKKRGTQKNVLERKAPPSFQIAIEINQKMNWFVHENITQSVDRLLQKQFPYLQSRKITKNSKISIYQNKNSRYSLENRTTKSKLILNPDQDETTTLLKNSQQVSIYSYSISINKVQQISESFGFSLFFTKDINKATAILALKSYINENQKLLTMAKSKKIPIYTVKKNTAPQIAKILTQIKKLKVKII